MKHQHYEKKNFCCVTNKWQNMDCHLELCAIITLHDRAPQT